MGFLDLSVVWVGLVVVLCVRTGAGKLISIEECGAIPGNSEDLATNNTAAIAACFQAAAAGDEVVVPTNKTYRMFGLAITGMSDLTLRIDGTLHGVPDFKLWPLDGGDYMAMLHFKECNNITITSSEEGQGLMNGNGYPWWWHEILQTLPAERPKLLAVSLCEDVLIENIILQDSPFWTLVLSDVARVEIRHLEVKTDVTKQKQLLSRGGRLAHISSLIPNIPWKDWIADLLVDLMIPTFPLNTDGIDVTGRDIYIHDCKIQNYDDCIVPKPCSQGCQMSNCTENILVEDVEASGVGMSIGSISPGSGHNCIRNVTFRNIQMKNTLKGIYIKTNPGDSGSGEVTDITYENFEIDRPFWWAVWIGPQQQRQPGWNWTAHEECSLDYPIQTDHCRTQPLVPITKVTLRNVTITDPLLSPGVLLCNETSGDLPGSPSCRDFVFDSVRVTSRANSTRPWLPYGYAYHCENVQGLSLVDAMPSPACG